MHYKIANIYEKSYVELCKNLTDVPRDKTSLDLSYNKLGIKNFAELSRAFAHKLLPLSITTLDLSSNELFRMRWENLKELFISIPESVSILDLSGNNFYQNPDLLIKVLPYIPRHVTHLYFKNNFFGLTSFQLAAVLAAIPSHIIGVDLSENVGSTPMNTLSSFYNKEVLFIERSLNRGSFAEWAQVVPYIPKTIGRLGLSANHLGWKNVAQLISIVASIPEGVRYFDFSQNFLDELSTNDLVQIFAALPKHISTLQLSILDISKRTPQEQCDLAQSLPSVKTFIFDPHFALPENIIIGDRIQEKSRDLPILLDDISLLKIGAPSGERIIASKVSDQHPLAIPKRRIPKRRGSDFDSLKFFQEQDILEEYCRLFPEEGKKFAHPLKQG